MLPLKNTSFNMLTLGYFAQGLAYLAVIAVPSLYFSQTQIGVLGIAISLQFILSQLFGLGLHFSSLYYKSIAISSSSNESYCTVSSKINVTLVSTVFGLIFYFIFPFIINIYSNFNLDDFKIYLIASVILIAINKVLLSELNASKNFSLIGKLYLFKSFVLLLIISLIVFKKVDFKHYLIYQLVIPELLIYLFYLSKTMLEFLKIKEKFHLKYLKRDLVFGVKSIWGTIFFEASTKVDVLMLGVYVSPEKVGIYTIISMISDLFLNVSSVLRTFLNPDITMNFMNQRDNFVNFIKQKVILCYKILVPFLILVVVLYLVATNFISQILMYKVGTISLIILTFFLALTSGFIPLMLTFGQIGKPNQQSVTFFVFFVANLLLNMALIPLFGIEGASLATGLSYLIYVYLFRTLLFKLDR
jgi:O-antigen/teichoic acid export membrane protein